MGTPQFINQILIGLKREIDSNTVINRVVNTLLSMTRESSRKLLS